MTARRLVDYSWNVVPKMTTSVLPLPERIDRTEYVDCNGSQGPKDESPFRYTLDNNKLTLAQRRFYEENGYLVIQGLFQEEVLDKLAKRFDDICEERVPKGPVCIMKEVSYAKAKRKDLGAMYKIQDISSDEVFEAYYTDTKLLDYVECFTGPTITVRQSMLINKPPDYGTKSSEHPPHQDLIYFSFRPVDRIVATWTAIERATVENGCLYVMPGSHKISLLPHAPQKIEGDKPTNIGFRSAEGAEKFAKTYVEVEKGDTVFFHPLLLHGSGLNLTKGSRKSILGHFCPNDSYHVDVTGTVQENACKELVEIVRRQGKNQTIEELWDSKAQQVRPPLEAH